MKITTESAKTKTLYAFILALVAICSLAGFISIMNHFQTWPEYQIDLFRRFCQGLLFSIGIAVFLWNIRAD